MKIYFGLPFKTQLVETLKGISKTYLNLILGQMVQNIYSIIYRFFFDIQPRLEVMKHLIDIHQTFI